jgi:hypothetical protein
MPKNNGQNSKVSLGKEFVGDFMKSWARKRHFGALKTKI